MTHLRAAAPPRSSHARRGAAGAASRALAIARETRTPRPRHRQARRARAPGRLWLGSLLLVNRALRLRGSLERARMRIRVGDEIDVRVQLRTVAERVGRAGCAGPTAPTPRTSATNQVKIAANPSAKASPKFTIHAGMTRDDSECRAPTVLPLRTGQLEVQRVAPGRTGEPRERIRGEKEEGIDVQRVAHEARKECVQRPGRRARDERQRAR